MRLSVVLATFNEENNINNCLQTIKDWCDEMIMVDGSSTDRTVEIARSLGAIVVVTNNPPIFHMNKQKAIDLAKGDWILQLDADERVGKELREEIDKAIEEKSINGYWIPRKNYFLGRFLTKGGQYPDYTLRLYRNGKGKLPTKDVHEQALVEGKVEYLKNPLLHIADPTLKRYFIRNQRYTDLLSREIQLKEKNFSIKGTIEYLFIKPIHWFMLTYIRHKGFLDSWQGFLFSFFSACRFPIAYLKFLKITHEGSHS